MSFHRDLSAVIQEQVDQGPEATPRGEVERRRTELVQRIDIRAEPQQHPRHAQVASFAHRPQQRRAIVLVADLDVGSVADQMLHRVVVQPFDGVEQRRLVPVVHGVDRDAPVEQPVDRVAPALERRPVKRCVAVDVLGRQRRPVPGQEREHRDVAAAGREVNGPTLALVECVDQLRIGFDERLDAGQVTLACGRVDLAGESGRRGRGLEPEVRDAMKPRQRRPTRPGPRRSDEHG